MFSTLISDPKICSSVVFADGKDSSYLCRSLCHYTFWKRCKIRYHMPSESEAEKIAPIEIMSLNRFFNRCPKHVKSTITWPLAITWHDHAIVIPCNSYTMQKLSRRQDFSHKNFPDKVRKSSQFSNSRQMHIKGGFARFCA